MPSCSLCRLRQCGAKLRRRSNHRIEVERSVDLLGKRLQFVLSGVAFSGAAQSFQQAIRRDRLDQIVRRAGAHGFYG